MLARDIEMFIEHCGLKGLSTKTINSYEQTLRLFMQYMDEQGILLTEKITHLAIQGYIKSIKERGKYTVTTNPNSGNYPDRRVDFGKRVSDVTINNYLRNLRVFFNWCVEEELILRSPVKKGDFVKVERKPLEFVSDEDFKRLLKSISSTISALLNFLGSDFGKTLMDTVKNGFTTYMPKIASFIGKLFEDGGLLAGIGKVVMGLFGEGGALAGVGEAVMGVLTTIAGVIGITVPELGLILLAIAAIGVAGFALIKNWDKVKEWFANFGEWISNLFQNIAEGIGNFVSNLVEGIGNVFKKIWEVGKNIGQGLWNGVTSVVSGIWNGIKGLGSWIVNGFKSIFGIHSPSTVMAELGAYMGQGFANGITSTEDGVNRSMDDMTSSALDIATNAAQMLYDVATGQEIAEPIFTPVLNLSDYASPTSWAATQAYTPSAETAERVYRSNELAQRIGGNQNGAFMKPQSDNSDVVNAISQLGNRVDRMAESISKMKLVLDSGKTVGELAPKIDSNMGGRNILAERGVI